MTETDFWMYPAAVTNQARAFDEWAEMVKSFSSWMMNHQITSIDDYPAYYRVSAAALNLRSSMIPWLSHLEAVLTGIGTELKDVASEALTQDLDEQAKIDATDPQTYEGYDQHPSGNAELAPDYEVLVDIGAVHIPPNGGAGFYCDLGSYEHLNDRAVSMLPDDILSPTGWVYTVGTWVGAHKLSELILREFGGRWGDMREFADTLAGLADMLEGMRGSLTSSAGSLTTVWQGYSANSAQAYFADLVNALATSSDSFRSAAKSFRDYCDSVEETAEAIADQLHALADLIVFAAVAAAFGVITVETLYGGLAGWSAAGFALLRAYYVVKEIREKVNLLTTIVSYLDTLIKTTSNLSDFTSSIPIPKMVASV